MWQLLWHITGLSTGYKVMELVILNQVQPILQEQGMPQQFQTAYCKKTSCADAIFANMESIMHYTNQGDRIFMCAYDLEKAFDTVEYAWYSDETYLQCWH